MDTRSSAELDRLTARFEPMSKKLHIAIACLIAFGLNCWDIPNPLSIGQAHAQSSTQELSPYTKNQLTQFRNINSVNQFNSRRYQNRAFTQSVPQFLQFSPSQVNRQSFSTFNQSQQRTRQKNKPFASVSRGPTVTPYLGLTGLPSGGATNYYANVKPQLEQQRVNQQAQQQNVKLQHQLNQMAAQAPFDPRGSEQMAPTGHAAVYLNLGGYYPEPR
jgi:hypothetical protein